MATFRKPVTIVRPDANCFPDLIANQITEAASPSVGDLIAYVLADGGADEGVYVQFSIPKNYVGTPKIVIKGIFDGAPSNGDDLGFGFRKLAAASNETADGSFAAEQTVQDTDIGGTGTAFSDEDYAEFLIALTAGDYAVDDQVYGYVYIDASGTTYAGNFLLTAIELEYTDS
jgi:hypothetical protein